MVNERADGSAICTNISAHEPPRVGSEFNPVISSNCCQKLARQYSPVFFFLFSSPPSFFFFFPHCITASRVHLFSSLEGETFVLTSFPSFLLAFSPLFSSLALFFLASSLFFLASSLFFLASSLSLHLCLARRPRVFIAALKAHLFPMSATCPHATVCCHVAHPPRRQVGFGDSQF